MDIIHIGLGDVGRRWLEAVREHPESRSVACVDTDVAALAWVKTHFPALATSCYTSLAEACQHVQAEAALITVAPATRAQQAIEALTAGLGVMLEAPLAVSFAEGVRLLETAQRVKRAVLVAQHGRFARCERTLQHLVRSGRLGTITHVSCMDHQAYPSASLREVGREYVQAQWAGVHHFDSLRAILNAQPVCVMARCYSAPWSTYPHGATTEALFEMTDNIHVQYYGSLTSSRLAHALWLEGDKGVLWTDRRRVWWRKRGWRFFMPLRTRRVPAGDGQVLHEGAMSLLRQLHAAVSTGAVSEASGADSLWTLAMVEATRRSDQETRVVHIAEMFAAGVHA